jgi:hypothetical protein
MDHIGPVLLVGMYHYISVIERSLLLIWSQHLSQGVEMTVLDPSKLAHLKDVSLLCAKMQRTKTGLLYEGRHVARVNLDTTVSARPVQCAFPPPINKIDELLILCQSSGAEARRTQHRLALLVAHPSKSTYRLYAQDWFNMGDFDYDYQWVTRVTRDPANGKVHGEGFRIAPFVLDDTLQNLSHSPR